MNHASEGVHSSAPRLRSPPVFFCPSRPSELSEAQAWFQKNAKRPISNNEDLRAYYSQRWTFGFAIMQHSWWRHYGNWTSFY